MNSAYRELLNAIFFSPLVLGVVEFPFTLTNLIFQFILPLGFFFIIYKIVLSCFKRLIQSLAVKDHIKDIILIWVKRGLRLLYLLTLFLLIGNLFGARIMEYWRYLYGALNEPLLVSGGTQVSFITILLTIPVFYLASWAGKTTRNMLNRSFFASLGLDEAQQFSIASLTRYVVMVLVLLVGLSVIGIDLSALVVVFGVLGLGLGFGLQSVVANLFAGFVIIVTRPVKEGDRILVNEYEGTIIQIRVLSTVINTLANETIIVPNSLLVSDTVYNYSYEDRSITIRNFIDVSYNSDLDKVLQVMQEVGAGNPYLKEGGEPLARVREFASSGITMGLFTPIREVTDKYIALHWNNLELWRAFKKNGIEIPFPQLDVHMKNGVRRSVTKTAPAGEELPGV